MKNVQIRIIGRLAIALVYIGLILFPVTKVVPQEIVTPESHFGFVPGADRMLFDYNQLISFLQKIDAASERFTLVEVGKSPMGRPIFIGFISSAQNLANLAELKAINKRLALDAAIPEAERADLIARAKVFVLATLSMHSGEVGPSQAAPLVVYQLITSQEPQVLHWLDQVVYMIVPSHNPDGMDMVVAHYRKHKNTPLEGSSMPGVYHKYVGHDNNRDFVTLSQEDTRVIARIYNLDWFPQVMVEKHQMGSTGPRYYVPPSHDPIAENVDAGIWNWTWIFGANMVKDMTEKGLAGVSQHYLFDDYWPGSTTTCIWKNIIGLLTECASVKYATPIFVEPSELEVDGKGLAEYKKGINMSLPWSGGWWRLSDIVDYELASTFSIIKTAAAHRSEILTYRNDLCRKEVENGKSQPPYYYLLPLTQHDRGELVELVDLLQEHGINVYSLQKNIVLDGKIVPSGTIVVPLAQPYRPFIKEVIERQKYPERHYTPGGELIQPYDITSWSLPLHMGVTAIEVTSRSPELEAALEFIAAPFQLKQAVPDNFVAVALDCRNNQSFAVVFAALKNGISVRRTQADFAVDDRPLPKGSFIVENQSPKGISTRQLISNLSVTPDFFTSAPAVASVPITAPRIALVETFFHDIDAGWTRFVFDSYQIPFQIIRPGDFAKTDFAKNFDVVIFPSTNKDILLSGKWKSEDDDYHVTSYPPEFTKGIGKEGMDQLMTFLDQGGIIIAWGQSTQLFTGLLEIKRGKKDRVEFQLPVSDLGNELKKAGLFCPGALLELQLLPDHPLTWGLPEKVGVFSRGRPVFATSIPQFDMDRRVIGKFPPEQILLSGYCEKEELLADKTAMVWLKKGAGQLVFYGFNPQFRASTHGSYKLLFNAILLPRLNSN